MTVAQRPDSGRLFQEDLVSDPYWMMVGCILVNRTHYRVSGSVLLRLMTRYGSPEGVAKAPFEDILDVVRPLGFQNRRTATLKNFTTVWLANPPTTAEDISRMPGCGQYAVHSWMIFMEGRFPPVSEIKDGKLAWYLEQRQ